MVENTVAGDVMVKSDLPKKKRGRPKCFSEQQALEKAMLLFWEYGYEATSISELTQALEITPPSLYSCFGDKASLFYRCIDYYLEHEACPIVPIFEQAKTAKVAFEIYLYNNIQRLLQPNKPSGCMLVVATVNCSEQTHDVQQKIRDKRLKEKEKLKIRLEKGLLDGDIAQHTPIDEMTDFYVTIIQGLTLQARDGATQAQLHKVVAHAMQVWDLFLIPTAAVEESR
ncbi:TetR/AcrR family transcriptional regulator [Acinetobacter sp. MD2]|uniref:TetR/AcrR family transcriptional regulator n=1 Tax=Acinetobacter sp. MD2 TaxID=2600066 RepID=UPI002D1EBE86|nr:TetR/AcrR family transcriptional regulator [Acinetobacter sp. MD2]MEB3766856.1 TetR/AcrR family transcriptional regulator [Acinetobacter sp. MD2]